MKIGIALVLVGLVFIVISVAQRRRKPVITDAERLAWIHGSGLPDGRSAMLNGIYSKRKLELRDVELAHQEIRDAIKRLVDAKRITVYHPEMEYSEVAYHRWFSTTRAVAEKTASNWSGSESESNAEMGMYVFDQRLFDLAMRSWHTTDIHVEKGARIAHAPRACFTTSIVGYRTNIAAYGGEHNEAFVVRFIDEHTVELDRDAQEKIDGYAGQFVPPETPTRYGFGE